MKYKVGDRVWFNGNKYIVWNAFYLEGKEHVTLKNDEVFIKGFISVRNIKPILKCK